MALHGTTERCTVDESILIYAVRYALGRHTYAPADVVRAVEANRESLTPNAVRTIVADVDGLLAGLDDRPGQRMDEIDGREWRRLREMLTR